MVLAAAAAGDSGLGELLRREGLHESDLQRFREEVQGAVVAGMRPGAQWGRKIIGWSVHEAECGELAAATLNAALRAEGIDGRGLVVHQDNGSPMKGATLKATMARLAWLSHTAARE